MGVAPSHNCACFFVFVCFFTQNTSQSANIKNLIWCSKETVNNPVATHVNPDNLAVSNTTKNGWPLITPLAENRLYL